MRQIFILTFLILLTSQTCFSQKTVDCNLIKNENGISFIDSKKTPYTGDCIMFHSNGKKSFEGQYKKGNTCGTCKWYYENGQISQQITYILDKENISRPDGKHTKWFEDGKIKQVVNYKAGNYEGEWYELDENGKVIKTGFYKNNKLIRGDKIKVELE